MAEPYVADKVDATKTEAMTVFSLAYRGLLDRRLARVPAERWAFNFVRHQDGTYTVQAGDYSEKGFDLYCDSPRAFTIPTGKDISSVISDELQLIARRADKVLILVDGELQPDFALVRQPMRSDAIEEAAQEALREQRGI